ncbi:MAG: imidazole glycerol phosphate synthase subunit HisH [Bacteroidaceae bacterium]|nr:imidazole glycerol phosphate synthase subunit HisH [Bacteroidaceae bacterium]
MEVAVIDYGAGNVFSVIHALRRLGVNPVLTDNPERIGRADKVVFPGQGEASHAMERLRQRGLDGVIRRLRQPMLGICIGQQLLCRHSEEGDTEGLGVFDVTVRKFRPERQGDKVPHMGWNTLTATHSPLMQGIEEGDFVYFVHSFYVPTCPWTVAETRYIVPFSAALQRDNFYATQFHPEKSGSVGERILRNFLDIKPGAEDYGQMPETV